MSTQRATKLDRMDALLAGIDHPERTFRSVLVAGTKGKGSTVAMLAACLQAQGLRTGRYTSPHLVNWRERTCINAMPISVDAVLALAEPIRRAVDTLTPALGQPTTFEVGTAFAFLYFGRGSTDQIDLAVVEVGTGGRFDATNLLEPLVSVITAISYDHTPTLGGTLSEIAWHKAGILRAGRPGVLAPQVDEARVAVEREARGLGTRLEEVGREWMWSETAGNLPLDPIRITSTHTGFEPLSVRIGLLGDHQRDNATAAVAALHALGRAEPRFNVARSALQAGLADVDWPGRLQVLSQQPLLVLDGAHNAASAEALRTAIDRIFRFQRLHLVVGVSEGKDASGLLEAFFSKPSEPTVYLTRSRHERSAAPAELERLVRATSASAQVSVHADLGTALQTALAAASSDDLVLVTGSLFLVGEALVWWRRSRR